MYKKAMIFTNLFQNIFQLNCFKSMRLRLCANGLRLYFKCRTNVILYFFNRC